MSGTRLLAASGGVALAVALVIAACAAPPPVVTPRPPVAPPPLPPPLVVPLPPLPPPAPEPAPVLVAPATLRVGLATDLPAVTLPCCDPGVTVRLGDRDRELGSGLRVEPAAAAAGRAVYRLQVAALKDEEQASGLATRIRGTSGLATDVVFDAASDLYKVRSGRFASRDEADAARPLVTAAGVIESFVVAEGGGLVDPKLAVILAGERHVIPGRWLRIAAPPDGGVAYGGGRYRGALLVYLNDRGGLNLINELGLEDYLRGVVPKEMGPALYGELEALQAQAVAARTYTVRNLGEFTAEGYDICSTPRCQVYGGMAVEHPLSDRAIAATAGQVVLYRGEPTETLYSATCGGHTENVEVVFPLKRGDSLRGTPCIEAGAAVVAGDDDGAPFPGDLARRLLPPSGGPAELELAARLEHLALLAGLPVPRDRLASLAPSEVQRYVGSVLDLALDRRLIATAAELRERLAAPPAAWGLGELRLADALLRHGLTLDAASESPAAGPVAATLPPVAVEEVLFELATYLGVVERRPAVFLGVGDGRLVLRRGGEIEDLPLPPRLATFRPSLDGLVGAPLELMPSDRLELYHRRGELLAAVQPEVPGRIALGRRGERQHWTRFVSQRDLERTVAERYPGFAVTGFEVLERGVSGRVGRLRLLGRGGRELEVLGLAVRWTLGLPDTLFRSEPRGTAGWHFEGSGWGHGVGMCQVGAFAMAQRGRDYREILTHYYRGTEIGELVTEDQLAAAAAGSQSARSDVAGSTAAARRAGPAAARVATTARKAVAASAVHGSPGRTP